MTFPAIILLIVFGAIFLGLVVMAVVHLFHAWRFGEHTPLAAITSGLFLLGILTIMMGVVLFLREVDWQQSFEIQLPTFTFGSRSENL